MLENVRAVQMGPGYIRSESYSRKTKIQGETASTLYTVRIQQHAVKKKKLAFQAARSRTIYENTNKIENYSLVADKSNYFSLYTDREEAQV